MVGQNNFRYRTQDRNRTVDATQPWNWESRGTRSKYCLMSEGVKRTMREMTPMSSNLQWMCLSQFEAQSCSVCTIFLSLLTNR